MAKNQTGRIEEAIDTLKEVTKVLRENQDNSRQKFMDIFSEMNKNLVKLDTTMQNVADKLKEHILEDGTFHVDADQRINGLEGDRNRLKGMAAGIGLVTGAVGALLSKVIH